MKKAYEILFGLFVGCLTFFIYTVTYGFIVAHLPKDFLRVTEEEFFYLQVFAAFEQFLAAVPMAVIAYIIIFISKFKPNFLFLFLTISIFLGNYIYIIYLAGSVALSPIYVTGIVMPCAALCFTLLLVKSQEQK